MLRQYMHSGSDAAHLTGRVGYARARWGAYIAPPDPVAEFKGPTSSTSLTLGGMDVPCLVWRSSSTTATLPYTASDLCIENACDNSRTVKTTFLDKKCRPYEPMYKTENCNLLNQTLLLLFFLLIQTSKVQLQTFHTSTIE